MSDVEQPEVIGALLATDVVSTLGHLALFLGGDDTSWTGDLLRLIQRSDPQNRLTLAGIFPRHVRAFELWMTITPTPTASELRCAMSEPRPGQEQLAVSTDVWAAMVAEASRRLARFMSVFREQRDVVGRDLAVAHIAMVAGLEPARGMHDLVTGVVYRANPYAVTNADVLALAVRQIVEREG